MSDLIVSRQSDAKKTNEPQSGTALLADWNELHKKAVKASDDDITKLTKSLNASWTDVSTLAKIACLNTQSESKSTLEQLSNLGPVKIDAATKMAYRTGAMSVEAIVTKVGSVGADLLSWFFGNGSEAKGSDAKSEIASTGKPEKASLAKPDIASAAGTKTDSTKGDATATGFLPDAIFKTDGIIFGTIENMTGLSLCGIGSKKPESQVASKPEEPAEAPVKTAAAEAEAETAAAVTSSDKPIVTPEIKTEDGKILYSSPDKSIHLQRNPDGSILTSVENKLTGVVGELFADIKGSRVYKEGEREIYKFLGGNRFTAGEFISDGLSISQVRDGKKIMVASKDLVTEHSENMIFVSDSSAKTLQEALANYKKAHPAEKPSNDTMMLWFQNGGALIHPSLERVLEFKRTNDGMELNYDLGNGMMMRRSPKGKIYIIDADQSVKELSDEQKKQLIAGLGAKAEVVRKLIASMETGMPIVLPDGQKISLEDNQTTIKSVTPNSPTTDGTPRKPTEVLMKADGWKMTSPELTSSFVAKTGQLTTESEGKPVTINVKSEQLDMVTEDFVRKDGDVTFVGTNVKIAADGAVDLPDGTKINAGNDVRFADGSTLYRDGTLVSKDGVAVTLPSLPHKPNLDAFVSQAIAMATAAAARVQSGSCSPSDFALIEANMSVVQNFINMFSIAGNLSMANGLYRSWSILKETYGKAQSETSQQDAAEKTREEEIRSFLKKLALENSQSSPRFEKADTHFAPTMIQASIV
ncbi:MAG: hypothetical protein SGJ27_14485 [Candidatus Melainabacteria bacterium]|nr:hypothetical protein [Candidatus Melainabacteria bacterium]